MWWVSKAGLRDGLCGLIPWEKVWSPAKHFGGWQRKSLCLSPQEDTDVLCETWELTDTKGMSWWLQHRETGLNVGGTLGLG